MNVQKGSLAISAAVALALALSSSAVAATIVHVGTLPPSDPYFYITSGTPTSPSITADFGATISGASTAFDDIFEFTIPQNGTGSGSLSTSFSAASNQLTIDKVLIDGVSYALTSNAGGQSLSVNGIPIHSLALNTLEVIGVTSASDVAATFSGTATFASAVPEPVAWAMMLLGVGFVGCGLRMARRKDETAPTAA